MTPIERLRAFTDEVITLVDKAKTLDELKAIRRVALKVYKDVQKVLGQMIREEKCQKK